jgi:hypothetical protein
MTGRERPLRSAGRPVGNLDDFIAAARWPEND